MILTVLRLVSIPKGAIEAYAVMFNREAVPMFQYQKVRLKLAFCSALMWSYIGFNTKRCD